MPARLLARSSDAARERELSGGVGTAGPLPRVGLGGSLAPSLVKESDGRELQLLPPGVKPPVTNLGGLRRLPILLIDILGRS